MPDRFSAEVVRSDGERSIVFRNGWTGRVEEYNGDVLAKIMISRSDKRVIWMLDPTSKTYTQAKLPEGLDRAFNPDLLSDWVAKGKKVIDGHSYQRFIGRRRQQDGTIGGICEICFIDLKTGMRRRTTTFSMEGMPALTVDWLNAVVRKPARKLFEMPPGYKRAYHKIKARRTADED